MSKISTFRHGKNAEVCFLVAFLIFMMSTVFILCAVSRTDDLLVKKNEYGQVTDVWITDTGEEVSLPQTLIIGDEGIHSLSCVLPEIIYHDSAIVYDAHYCGQKVYVDGNLVYSFAAEPTMPFGTTRGNARVLVPLGPDDAGKTLTIEMINPFGTNETTFTGIYFGPAGEFKFILLYENIWRIVMAAVLFAIAIIMLLLGFSHLITKSSVASTFSFFYFTLFATSVSVWIMTDTSVLQLFSSETTVGQYVAFLSLIGIGTFDMGLCACLVPGKVAHFHLIETLGYILGVLYFVLYVLDVADPVNMMPVVCLYGAICVVAPMVLSAMEFKSGPRPKIVFIGNVILTVGVGYAVLQLALDPMKSGSMWPVTGSYTVYMLLLFVLLMHYEQSILSLSNQSGVYWKMAYTDQLTGIANRAAMERIFDSLEDKREESHEILFFMADLNDLKKTNDSKGHEAGDELICAAANCMSAVFYKGSPEGKSLLSFRLGGDEFAAIVVDSKQPVEYYYDRLHEELQKSKATGIDVSIAIGHAICRYPEDGVNLRNGLYRAADNMMYERKLEMKHAEKK